MAKPIPIIGNNESHPSLRQRNDPSIIRIFSMRKRFHFYALICRNRGMIPGGLSALNDLQITFQNRERDCVTAHIDRYDPE